MCRRKWHNNFFSTLSSFKSKNILITFRNDKMKVFVVFSWKLKDILRPELKFIPRLKEMYGMCLLLFSFKARCQVQFRHCKDA